MDSADAEFLEACLGGNGLRRSIVGAMVDFGARLSSSPGTRRGSDHQLAPPVPHPHGWFETHELLGARWAVGAGFSSDRPVALVLN